MGDACYLRIIMKREDLDRFGTIMHAEPGEPWWNEEHEEPAHGIVDLGICDANYAWGRQRLAAAKAGIPFYGWHGEGDEYGAYNFASLDGELVDCHAARDGDLLLAIDHDLNIKTDIQHVRRYVTMLKAVRELFGIESQDRDAGAGISDTEYVLQGGFVCPYCGSKAVEAECAPVVETREAWQDVVCCDCGKTWRDKYDLVGYEDLDAGTVPARRAA